MAAVAARPFWTGELYLPQEWAADGARREEAGGAGRGGLPHQSTTGPGDDRPRGGGWRALMWLGQVPWAGRYWALPFLTVLAPSARYHRQRGRRHKKLTDWARQMVLQPRSW